MNTAEEKEMQIKGGLKLVPYAGLIIAGFLLVSLASYGFQFWKNEPRASEKAAVDVRLKNRAELNAVEEKLLHGYGWVDQNAGLVRIPVEQAMDLALPELKRKQVSKGAIKVEAAPAVK